MPNFTLITSLGLGYLRPAPGTWGSLLTIAVAVLLMLFRVGPTDQPVVYHTVMLSIFLLFALACITTGDAAEARFLRKDPSEATADETAGQVLPLVFLPATAWQDNATALFTLVFAFLTFRVLDIFKPWPANRLQSVPGGWGILLDDLMAGFYAAVVIQLASRWSTIVG